MLKQFLNKEEVLQGKPKALLVSHAEAKLFYNTLLSFSLIAKNFLLVKGKKFKGSQNSDQRCGQPANYAVVLNRSTAKINGLMLRFQLQSINRPRTYDFLKKKRLTALLYQFIIAFSMPWQKAPFVWMAFLLRYKLHLPASHQKECSVWWIWSFP